MFEKGLSALESLLFAKYQMYRNVYWHHAVRSATAMYKRLVEDALAAGILRLDEHAMVDALGIAATQSAGLTAFINNASMTKPLNVAKAVHRGILAAPERAPELRDEGLPALESLDE